MQVLGWSVPLNPASALHLSSGGWGSPGAMASFPGLPRHSCHLRTPAPAVPAAWKVSLCQGSGRLLHRLRPWLLRHLLWV